MIIRSYSPQQLQLYWLTRDASVKKRAILWYNVTYSVNQQWVSII